MLYFMNTFYQNPPSVSVVVPMFNEEDCVEHFVTELHNVLLNSGLVYDVVIVDDASTDQTPQILAELNYPNFRSIRLHRNSGHSSAMWTGMSSCTGDLIMTLDGDLQHPPFVIPLMIEQMNTCNSQVVYGIRKNLDVERFSKRLSTKLFFLIVRYIYGIRLEPYANDFRLISRDVFEMVTKVDSSCPTLRAILPQLQLATSMVEFDLRPRLNGQSKFTIRKMAVLFLDTVTYAPKRRLVAFSIGILLLLSVWVLLFSTSVMQISLIFALLPFQIPHLRTIYKKFFE